MKRLLQKEKTVNLAENSTEKSAVKPTVKPTEQALYKINQLRNPSGIENLFKEKDFNADLFCELTELNSTFVLTHQRLRNLSSAGDLLQIFETRFSDKLNSHSARAGACEAWLKELLRQCHEQNIEVVLLKGSLIGATLAPLFSYKKMNDIDLLIHPHSGPRFIKLIQDMGFLSVGTLFHNTEFSDNNHHTPPFYSPDMSCILGIHWHLCSPYAKWKPYFEDIWYNKVKITCLGQPAYRMKWEHNLLHLCIHLPFFKIGLRELEDVAAILDTQNLDWHEVERLISQWRAWDPAYRVLSLAQALHDSYVPEHLLKQCQLRTPSFVIKDTQKRIRNKSLLLRSRSTHIAKIEKAYSISRLSKDPAERAKAWLATWKFAFFPPKKELTKMLGSRWKAPYLTIYAMSRDYGWLPFWIITILNIGNAVTSTVKALLGKKGDKLMESKEFKLYAMLE